MMIMMMVFILEEIVRMMNNANDDVHLFNNYIEIIFKCGLLSRSTC